MLIALLAVLGVDLIWTKAPFLFRNELVRADGLGEPRAARANEVKRLGDQPTVTRLRTEWATIEVAAGGDDSERLLGPYHAPVASGERPES